jgi:hypothetical protein
MLGYSRDSFYRFKELYDKGGELALQEAISENPQIAGIVKASLSDVKQGSFVGVTAMPQADGSGRALGANKIPDRNSKRHNGQDLHKSLCVQKNSAERRIFLGEFLRGILFKRPCGQLHATSHGHR